jgi:hypothetical protein
MGRVLSFVSSLFSAASILFLVLGLISFGGLATGAEPLTTEACPEDPGSVECIGSCTVNGTTCKVCTEDDEEDDPVEVCDCFTTPCPN